MPKAVLQSFLSYSVTGDEHDDYTCGTLGPWGDGSKPEVSMGRQACRNCCCNCKSGIAASRRRMSLISSLGTSRSCTRPRGFDHSLVSHAVILDYVVGAATMVFKPLRICIISGLIVVVSTNVDRQASWHVSRMRFSIMKSSSLTRLSVRSLTCF